MNKEKIETLQVLRCIAFIAVLLTHTGINLPSNLGGWGVSVFLVLSGFTMIYSYYGKDRIVESSVRKNIAFTRRKIGRLYPLHVLMTIVMVADYIGHNIGQIAFDRLSLTIILNLLLIQEYFPLSVRSFNSVSWFLCTIVLAYFLFPWILRRIEYRWSNRRAIAAIVACVFITMTMQLLGSVIPTFAYGNNPLWTNEPITWFNYRFPLVRIWDFVIGCNLGYIYIYNHVNHDQNGVHYLWYEIEAIVIALAYLYYSSSLKLVIPNTAMRWWVHTLWRDISAITLIYAFAIGRGFVSNLLVNQVTLYLAQISAYGFLIHKAVYELIDDIVASWILFVDNTNCLSGYTPWLHLTLGIILTLILAELWRRIDAWGRVIFIKLSRR